MRNDSPSRLEIAFERRRLALKQAFFHLWTRITDDSRPSSYPYVSGDGFRALAWLKFDSIADIEAATAESKGSTFPSDKNDGTTIDHRKGGMSFTINRGDIVFVASPVIKDFFERIHPKITNRYILITHVGDENIDERSLKYIDDKIIHWFAQNVTVEHPKITPIPIGLESLRYYQNGITSFFRRLQRRLGIQLVNKSSEKLGRAVTEEASTLKNKMLARKPRIFFHFKVRTNPDARQTAFDYFNADPLAETMPEKLLPWLYLKKLSSYMFVASPPGNGEDCHRTWEALYLKTVPIVKDSAAMRSFAALGLPIWIVKDWHDLDGLNEDGLSKKYEDLIKKADWKALDMDYWIQRLKAAADLHAQR